MSFLKFPLEVFPMKNKIGNVPVASFPLGEDRLLYREEKKKVMFSGTLCYLLGSFDLPNSTSIEERDSFPWGLPEKAEESLLPRS